MLWRILFVVFCLVVFNLLLAPVLQLIGIPIDGNALLIVRVCVGALAIYYIVWGKSGLPQ